MSMATVERADADPLEMHVADARAALRGLQRDDGHWLFELEADATIPAEYILMRHFLGEAAARPGEEIETRIAVYLRSTQAAHGGWPLFHAGDFDMSASVKAYYALKIAGDDVDAPHMARARAAILERGGAARANVFTRITLALFGQVPWRAVPVMPVEIVLLPRWFPFHLDRVSYWTRTVLVPLLVLMALKPRAANPRGVGIAELFMTPPDEERNYNHSATDAPLGRAFLALDRILRNMPTVIPKGVHWRAIQRAMAFTYERLNGEDGLGAIFPAMVNAVEAMHVLGLDDDPRYATARHAIEKLLVERDVDGAPATYCQPCVSPIWDTSLALHAMLEADGDAVDNDDGVRSACDWLVARQVLDVDGDYAAVRPGLRPGGWPFQYTNDHYPDVDDTAVVAMALHRADPRRYAEPIARAEEWVLGMQSRNGGWGAFDADNTHGYLNHIPFADHGALLDPPTADVSARCVSFLCQLGYPTDHPVVARGLAYLRAEQEADGSWFGRWGTNYVYGTWSVLCALAAAGLSDDPAVRRAVKWLETTQRADGGWGEDGATYWADRRGEAKTSTPSQTAWGVLALMAAGEAESAAVRRGIAWLSEAPRDGARWREDLFTAVGFPRVFYLKYHGYAAYFPLWALARYRRLMARNDRTVEFGM